MNWLLVDNSNTRTKFALCDSCGHLELRLMNTAEINRQRIRNLLHGWRFSKVYICSVVPDALPHIEAACEPAEVHHLTPDVSEAVDFSTYQGIGTLGADRIANVLGAVQHMPLPFVAVDLGTAATFDVVVQGGARPSFKGGVIAPGIRAMGCCLHGMTAQLPSLTEWKNVAAIGRNTLESMGSALRIGYPAMVDAILNAIEHEVGAEINVVLTGGDASSIEPYLHRSCSIDPLLTLRGIAFAAGIRV